jgi:hypothetical protein
MKSKEALRFENAVNNLCGSFERICKVLNKEKIQKLEKVVLK